MPLSLLFTLLAASADNRASLSLAIPVTSDSLIFFVEAVEAIEAVGNGGNFGGCKVALTVVVVLLTPWWLLSVNVILSEDEADE
jgi:hypothetical protein